MGDLIVEAIVALAIVVTTAYYSYRNLTKLTEQPAPTKQLQTQRSQEVGYSKPPRHSPPKRRITSSKNKKPNKKSASSTASFENLNDIAMNRVTSNAEDELKKNQVPCNTQSCPHVIEKYENIMTAVPSSSSSTKRLDKNGTTTTKMNSNLEKGCAMTCPPSPTRDQVCGPTRAHNHSNNVRNNEAVIAAPRRSPNLSIKSSKPLCRFFLKGYCRNGLDCPFVHDTASVSRKSSGDDAGKRPTTNNSSAAAAPKFRSSFLVDDGILCDFGAGLVIQKLVLGTSIDDDGSSAIAISGLSVYRKILTRCDVEQKLSCYGELRFLSVNQEKTYIVAGYDSPSMAAAAIKSLNGSTVQSWICAASSSSTRKVKDGQQSRTGRIPGKVTVVPLRSNAAATTSSSFAVKVMWYAPSRFAWVHFRHYCQAEFAAERCHGQLFCGRALTASVQSPSRLQWNNFSTWIGNLGEHVNRAKLQNFIEKRVECDVQSIDLGAPCFTDKSAPSIVRQLIETHGAPLVTFESSTPNTMDSRSSRGTPVDLKRRALVRFATEEDAERACEYFRLQGKLEELGGGKLFLQRLFSIKYRIPTLIFEALESGIEAALNTSSAVRYSVFENRTSKSVLVYTDTVDAIEQIKRTMCSIMDGEIVRVPTQGNRILWNRYIASAEFREKSLTLAASVPGSYVWVNERRQEVRVFGSNDRRLREICQKVVNHCLGNAPTRLIPISRKLFDFIIQSERHHVLYKAARASCARFVSIDFRRKSLLVKGSEVSAARAKAYLMKLASFQEDGNPDPHVVCPVCFCPSGESGDLDRCVRLSCGHSYCRDCFDAWLSMPQFPLICLSEECSVPVAIFDFSMNLDGDALLCLLRSAIDDHVRKNPQSLQFCVSPTCGGIYEIPANTDWKDTAPPTTTASCSSCSLDICIKCRAAHSNMTCKDYHLTRLPPEKLRLKIIDDILTLRCPRCHQAFLDFEGCFALTCSVCPCHFCAWCLADCGQNAHPHVKICPRKDHASCGDDSSYYGTLEQFEAAQKRNRRDRLTEFLKNFPRDQQQSTMQSIQQDLSDLGIQIDG